jgi:hypothetical protein
MNSKVKIILSTSYLGPIEYFAKVAFAENIVFDPFEHYIKQTFRNRCVIATANGEFPLIIPVNRPNGNHTKVKDVEISYFEKWQQLHWRTLNTAYSHSPFFLYYLDALEPLYHKQFKYLYDFNQQLFDLVLSFLKVNPKIKSSAKYIEEIDKDTIDLRNSFSPKRKSTSQFPPYIQVFDEKHGFIPNLSIIDLLFNEGPAAIDYLRNLNVIL